MNMLAYFRLVILVGLVAVPILAIQVAGAPFAASRPDSAHPLAPAQGEPTVCLQPPAGMIGWWPFDRLEYFDSGGGDWYRDKAGINNVANPFNGPTETTGEHVANSVHLNGTDQFIRVAAHPELALGTGDFSIDAWIRIDEREEARKGRRPIVDKSGLRPGGEPYGYTFFLEAAHLGFSMHGEVGTLALVLSEATIGPGWHFVAVTVERKSGESPGLGTLYIDAVPVETFAIEPSKETMEVWADLIIGAGNPESGDPPQDYFWGDIDELELFRRALAPQELKAIFEHGPAGKCKAPITPTPPFKQSPIATPFGDDALVNIDVVNQCGAPASGFRFVLSSFGNGAVSNPPGYYSFDEVFEVPCPNPNAPQATDCNPFSTPVAVPSYTASDITLGWSSSTVQLGEAASAHFGYTLVQGDEHTVSAQLMQGASTLCVAVAESSDWSSDGITVTLTLENRSAADIELVPRAMTSPEYWPLDALLPSNNDLMRGLGNPLPSAVLAPGERHAIALRTRPEDRFAIVLADWYAYDGGRGALWARAFHGRSFTDLRAPATGRLYLPWAGSVPWPPEVSVSSESRYSSP